MNKKADIANFLRKTSLNKEIPFPGKGKSKSEYLLLKNKKADILHEHVIFIVLNVIFFSIMLLFIYIQGNSVHLMEEETAKQIALLIDAAKPGTTIEINLKDLFAKTEKDEISKKDSVKIDNDNNLVIVKGSEKTFYEYSYFNDIDFEYNIKEDYLVLIIK